MSWFKQIFTRWKMNRWDTFLPLLVLFVLFGILTWQLTGLISMNTWVNRANTNLVNLRHLETAVLDIENEVRGFQLTQDRHYLGPYEENKQLIQQTLINLDRDIRHPALRVRLPDIRAKLNQWLEYSELIVREDLRNSFRSDRVIARSEELMDSIRREIAEMIDLQREVRVQREEEVSRNILTVFSWFTFIMICLTFILLRNWIRNRHWARELEASYHIAQESIKAREDVVNIVSHDLKNPLSAIVLNVKVLKKMVDHADGMSRLLAIEKASLQGIRLIQDLLDHTKLELGSFAINPGAFRIHELIREVEAIFRPIAEQKNVKLLVRVQVDNSFILTADFARVLQVLSNLLGNAIKHTDAGGVITLEVKTINSEVEFSIKDTGAGISSENLQHLFDRYWRGDQLGRYNLGLGLSIAHGIVKGHGGRIWVQSKLGEGTVFYFTLPISEQASILPPMNNQPRQDLH
jgi:signal transduction histidine kinase